MATVTQANINEAEFFARMILDSAEYFPLIFGNKVGNALIRMFRKKHNLFSHQLVYKIEIKNEVAAMLLGYSYKLKRKVNLRTGYLMFRYLSLSMLRNLKLLMVFNNTTGRLNPGEYYISNIGTFAKFRNKGYAKQLLHKIEELAKNENLKNLVLDVEKQNFPAIHLYETLNFRRTRKFTINIREGFSLEFIRMTKLL